MMLDRKIVRGPIPFLLLCHAVLPASAASPAGIDKTRLPVAATHVVDFEKEIRPVFARHCYSCHGPEKQRNNFRLDDKAAALKGGDDYAPDIVPGKSDESPLIHFVAGLVADRIMPQKGERLTAEQISLLRAWIDQGAPWPDGPESARSSAQRDYWLFKPHRQSAIPRIRKKDWPRNPIDYFILEKLEQKGLEPNSQADKMTLLRRATFDLHGLPPTPKELDDFLSDQTPDAFVKVVDRLLASPRYGERWARHWLDVARFSESQGFEYDKIREHAWRYRDYVIRSFNEDKPYAQFIQEQIAGDALEPVTRQGIVATSFLVAGPWDEAGSVASKSDLLKARIREEELEDMISAVGQTFLGVTINCARCHDHKFDPIPQRDYYRLKAAFAGVRHGEKAIFTAEDQKVREAALAQANSRVKQLEREITALEDAAKKDALIARATATSPRAPLPFAKWTFETNANDSAGALHGKLHGGAALKDGRLQLNARDSYMETEPLRTELREKTLEAWVALSNLSQRGGGVMAVELNRNGESFDAIVYGEREPMKWIAGSEFFQRTRDLPAPVETAGSGELIHMAISYSTNHSIAIYRNGERYGSYSPDGEQASLRSFPANNTRILVGLRHHGAGNGFFEGAIEEAHLYDRALDAGEIAASFRCGPPIVTPAEIVQALTSTQRQQREALLAELALQKEAARKLSVVPLAYAANSRQPEATFVLARGDVEKKREEVVAGGLSAVRCLTEDFGLAKDAPEALRRLKMAEWIVNSDNPLTWRVFVNRVWHYHFGRGIVATPNDFGANGEQPTHPELLDWLASEFIAGGGSAKKLHRLIMLSSAYQQSFQPNDPAAAIDSDNRMLWRYPLRRLEAEEIRDAMLHISGQLNLQMAGPGFRPFTVFTNNSHFYTLTDRDEPQFNRRTIYRINVQSARNPLLDSLDCPDPSTKTPARNVTTTPIQALGMMNNSFVQRQAQRFAERLEVEAGKDPAEQINLAYRLVVGRQADGHEIKRALALARQHGMESVGWVLLNASEFLYVK